MSDTLMTTILAIFTPLLTIILGGLGSLVAIQMSRWQAREKLKVMTENARLAVQAIEQTAQDKPPEVKKQLALTLAQSLNATAGITIPDDTQVSLNEAHVLTLPQGG